MHQHFLNTCGIPQCYRNATTFMDPDKISQSAEMSRNLINPIGSPRLASIYGITTDFLNAMKFPESQTCCRGRTFPYCSGRLPAPPQHGNCTPTWRGLCGQILAHTQHELLAQSALMVSRGCLTFFWRETVERQRPQGLGFQRWRGALLTATTILHCAV